MKTRTFCVRTIESICGTLNGLMFLKLLAKKSEKSFHFLKDDDFTFKSIKLLNFFFK
jgi:hypothetical protein